MKITCREISIHDNAHFHWWVTPMHLPTRTPPPPKKKICKSRDYLLFSESGRGSALPGTEEGWQGHAHTFITSSAHHLHCLEQPEVPWHSPWLCWQVSTLQYTRLLCRNFLAVFRIRIHRNHMFLGLPDPNPDPLVRGMDPDPYIIMQK